MGRILTKPELNQRLMEYYRTRYGRRSTDTWYAATPVNMKVFARDGELISLKCHPLTGQVTAKIEKL